MKITTTLSSKKFAALGCTWLLGIMATTAGVSHAANVEPISYKKCFSDSSCGLRLCGGSRCNCCYRSNDGVVYWECVDGSCVPVPG